MSRLDPKHNVQDVDYSDQIDDDDIRHVIESLKARRPRKGAGGFGLMRFRSKQLSDRSPQLDKTQNDTGMKINRANASVDERALRNSESFALKERLAHMESVNASSKRSMKNGVLKKLAESILAKSPRTPSKESVPIIITEDPQTEPRTKLVVGDETERNDQSYWSQMATYIMTGGCCTSVEDQAENQDILEFDLEAEEFFREISDEFVTELQADEKESKESSAFRDEGTFGSLNTPSYEYPETLDNEHKKPQIGNHRGNSKRKRHHGYGARDVGASYENYLASIDKMLLHNMDQGEPELDDTDTSDVSSLSDQGYDKIGGEESSQNSHERIGNNVMDYHQHETKTEQADDISVSIFSERNLAEF